ncbi:hypothetical protein GCM10009087_41750 [Sphingomonas oligophenolica]|uniref:Uncharacterized protein n=1 Tax=Sphingomonas oligophenolica TaxID=301154 RepID=A0ABU9YBH9_9SPHN
MNILQLLRCAKGHHVRSGRRARFVNGRRESVCRGCGRKMVKEDQYWRLADDGGTAQETQPAT